MRKAVGVIIRTVFLLFACLGSYAQSNNWIRFDQQYFKILTAEDRMYRVSFTELINAEFPAASVPADRLQLYHRGIEQAIQVEDGGDNRLDPGDYIEFYGIRNDGTLDRDLYLTPEAQPHPYYNLYSDSTAYFLTWSQSAAGKRMEQVTGTVTSEPKVFHWREQLETYNSNYSAGRRYPVGGAGATYRSQFDFGEGFTGPRIRNGNFQEFEFNPGELIYTAGPPPQLEVLLAGRNEAVHNVEVSVGPDGNLRSLGTVQFQYFDNQLFNSALNWSDLSSGQNLKIRVTVTSPASDQVSVSYIRLRFPETPDMGGIPMKVFEIPAGAQARQFTVSDVPPDASVFDISDPDNVKTISITNQGSAILLTVPASSQPVKLLVSTPPALSEELTKKSFRNIDPTQHDYLMISHQSLRKPTGDYQDPVAAYAAYRASASGGAFDTLLVNMDQLYDQFNYGEKSPLAIRSFMEYMLQGNPRYLLLVGKGYNVNFNPDRQDPLTATTFNLVPTAGFPGSDNALTAGLNGSGNLAAIPTGRINAREPFEVAAYLNKLTEMESLSFDALWRKRLIHLSGGLTQSELVLFKRYVDQFKAVAEGPYFGGQVTTINKQSNEATVLIDIADEVNQGVSLITFFGHSSTSVTDIEIGKVSDVTLGYNNTGRYPMIMVNGCNAGNIFFTSTGFGEDWILTADKGAIGYLAHTDAGFASNLKRYSDIFYDLAYADSAFINKPIGDILQELGRRYLQGVTQSEIQIAQVQQEVYQGDPAFSFFPVDRPDFETNNDQLFLQGFNNETINAQVDSFQVAAIVRNFGRATDDSLNVTVRRTFADGQMITYDSVFYAPVFNQDTIYFTVRSNQLNNFGNNQFELILDYNQSIEELDETNNSGILSFFIPQGGTVNLNPFDFAIVNQQTQQLIAQASDLLTGSRTFLFEIDTTKQFNSLYKQNHLQPGDGIASWEVNLLPGDSTVYYWRTRFQQPREGEDTTWILSSFIYIDQSPLGWSQARFPQFDDNFTDPGLDRDQQNGLWTFTSTQTQVEITTFGSNHPMAEPANISVTIDGQPFIVSTRLCPQNSFNAIAFDQASTIPYAVLTDGGFDVLDRNRCGRTPQAINTFLQNDIVNDGLLDQYFSELPDGDQVILFSIGLLDYSAWSSATLNGLSQVGVDLNQLGELPAGAPVIIVGSKGAVVGSALVIKADEATGTPSSEQEITLDHTLEGKFDNGLLLSPKIGPAASWGNLHHQIMQQITDQVTLDLLGIDNNGIERLLIDNITQSTVDLNGIDAAVYPYLRLRLKLQDPDQLNPAQLKRWQVIFDPLPDGVLLFRGNSENGLNKIPLLEGQLLTSDFTFYNHTTKEFADSLVVRTTLFNRNTRQSETEEFKILAPEPGDSINFNQVIDSRDRAGINDYRVFVNPNLQPERFFTNNINDFQEYLEISPDNTHPILDVTFDGIHILDGDIVSPSPLIGILLKDDNQFDLKQDTVGMELFIKDSSPDCSNCEFQRISFSSPQIRWTPATDKEDFRIEYQPEPLADGIYTLRVQGEDNSGRKSGSEPYTINFEVINESTITNFYPYPNPFSTSTRFVFTLTGSEIPDQIKIQIMTVTGKVVREITQDELGIVRIGNNITDYAWDGKDEYGDQLANGVYIYRVVMNRTSDTFKHRETSGDKAFKKGYGKLYLLR